MSMAANSDIVVSRPVPAWQQKLATFWRWWIGELAAMVPDRFARGSRVPVLSIENDEVVLLEPKSAAGPAARVPTAALEAAQARAAVRGVLERAGETRARARLCLSRDEALVRRVSMPAATEENLAQVIGFEMDRLTPFRAEEVYFDQRVLSRDPAAGQVEVQLAVARRDLVDARVARLRDLGVSVQGVAVRGDSGHGAGVLDLLPSAQRGERESANERFAKRALAALVAVLLAVALVLPAWQKRESIIAMHPTITKAKQEAEATDALARTLERQVADYNFVQGKRHGAPALAYLEDVSRLLPDNTWVQQFELRVAGKSREVQITGETTSSSKLIEILEQSTLLQNAAPRGTVTRGAQPGTERFMIAAEARPRPLPQARPAQEVAALPPPPEPVLAQPAAAAPPIAVGENSSLAPPAEAGGALTPAPPPATARVVPVAPGPISQEAHARRETLARQQAERAQALARKEALRAERKAVMDARARDAAHPPALKPSP